MSIMEEQGQADRIDLTTATITPPPPLHGSLRMAPQPAEEAPLPKPVAVMDEGGFDLGADLAAESDVEIGVVKVHVRDKSGRPRYFLKNEETVPVTVTIHNSYTERAQKVDQRMRKDKVRGRVTYDTLFKRQMYKLVQCTTDWEGIVDANGRPKPFSRPEIERYYLTNPFLRKDALEALEDDEGEDFFET